MTKGNISNDIFDNIIVKYSDEDDGKVTMLTDTDLVAKITGVFGDHRIADDEAAPLAMYNGIKVDPGDAVVFQHIVDGFVII